MVPCRDLPLPPTTFPEEGEVTETEGLGPQRYTGPWQACRHPLGPGVLPPSLHSAPPPHCHPCIPGDEGPVLCGNLMFEGWRHGPDKL